MLINILSSLSKLMKEFTKVANKEFWDFHGWKMASGVMLVPVSELVLWVEYPTHQRVIAKRNESLRSIMGLSPRRGRVHGFIHEVSCARPTFAKPINGYIGQ